MEVRSMSCQLLVCHVLLLSWKLRMTLSQPPPPTDPAFVILTASGYEEEIPNINTKVSMLSPEQQSTYFETYNYQIMFRDTDIFIFNAFKYYINIVDFHDKLNHVWKPQVELVIPQDPFRTLGKVCHVSGGTELDLFGHFVQGFITPNDIASESDTALLENNCFERGVVPTQRCVFNFDNVQSECACAQEDIYSKWTPFVYAEPEQTELEVAATGRVCEGREGAICDGVNIPCIPQFTCTDGFCGGVQAALGRGVGGFTEFTDKALHDLLKTGQVKSMKEAELHLIRTSYFKNVIGKSCNFFYWKWATHLFAPVLTTIGNKADFEPFMSRDYRREVGSFTITDAFPTYLAGSLLDGMKFFEISNNSSASGDFLSELYYTFTESELKYLRLASTFYDDGSYCLDEYPRMHCVQSPNDPNRGRCTCAPKISKFFDYFEENGQCVGKEGVVCTTVRGSGDHNCAKGLKCESVQDLPTTGIPSALSYHEIKICQNVGSIKTNATSTNVDGSKEETKHSGNEAIVFRISILLTIFTFFNLK